MRSRGSTARESPAIHFLPCFGTGELVGRAGFAATAFLRGMGGHDTEGSSYHLSGQCAGGVKRRVAADTLRERDGVVRRADFYVVVEIDKDIPVMV